MSKQANLHTIQLCSLSIGYAGKKQTKVVAQDINASIHGGELTCLLGANGAGKSTLLRTLSAFQPKLNGQTRVMGKEIGLYTDKELATIIGVVLTDKCDVRNMTVEELVGMGRSPYTGFWGRLRGRDREIVKESISLVKIEPYPPDGTYPERRRKTEGDDCQSTGTGNTGNLPGRTHRLPRFSQ